MKPEAMLFISDIFKQIYSDEILHGIKKKENVRIGFSLIIPSLLTPINVEYTAIENIQRKIDSLHDRLEKVNQSNNTADANQVTAVFTIINIKPIKKK